MNMPNPDDRQEPAENPYPNGPTKGFLPGKMYDKLKWLALIFLPAFGTLYFSLGAIWSLPNTDEVVKTIMALETFLGLIIGISNKAYMASDARFAGALNVYYREDEAGVIGKVFQVDLGDLDPWTVDRNKELTLKVNPPAPVPPR